ncbi:MAG: glycosyltransferase, partial [Peptococcaceae bacterium]|nr:glycosyltransferase [Peptococcaceae bacterium]
MRILIISHMYPNSMKPLSGIFVQKQAEALARQGLAISLIAPVPYAPLCLRHSARWGGYRLIPPKTTHAGFTVYHPRVVELPRNLLFEYAPQFYAAPINPLVLAEAAKGIDLIHAHVAHPDGAVAVKLGQRLGVPVVVTIHGQDFAYTLQRSKACAASVRHTLKMAARVILVSEKLKTQYDVAAWADDLAKYRVIYNGVNLADVAHAADSAG